MAATPYPLPRETRESAILVGNGTVGPYGPSLYKIFDTADVKVFAKLLGATVYSDVTANCTIAKVNPASAYDFFTVTFNAAVLATTSWKHQARRTAERSVAVTKAGTLTADELEKELSKQASAQSELRRDVSRAVSFQLDYAGATDLPAAEAGKVLGWDASGTKLENKSLLSFGLATVSALMTTVLALATYAEAWLVLKLNGSLSTRALIKALTPQVGMSVLLTEPGRVGNFIWRLGDYSAQIAMDTSEGVYLKADSVASNVGAWVRDFEILTVEHFGASTTATRAANRAAIQCAINVAQAYVGGLMVRDAYLTDGAVVQTAAMQFWGYHADKSKIVTNAGAALSIVPTAGIATDNTWWGWKNLTLQTTEVGRYGIEYASAGNEYMSNFIVEGVKASGPAGGVSFDSSGSTVGIFSCTFRRNWFDNGSLFKDIGDSVHILENTVNGNNIGILVNGVKGGAQQLVIADNNITTRSECVYLLNVSAAHIDRNWMETPSYLGSYTGTTGALLYTQACPNTRIERNTIQPLNAVMIGLGQTAAAYSIRLNTSGDASIIEGNRLIAIGNTGHIQIGGGVTNTYIKEENKFDATPIITDAGTGTFGAGNTPGVFNQVVRFTTTAQFTSVDIAESTNAGTGNGPYREIYRNKAGGAAVNDGIGGFLWYMNNSVGVKTNLGYITMTVLDPVSGTEDGQFNIARMLAGALVVGMTYGATFNFTTGGTFTGTITPATNDGGALGTGALGWSDLFGATGFVWNIGNGNYTVTHAAGQLTFSGIVIATQYNVGANKVVGARDTGWTAMTGTGAKTALAAAAAGTASGAYVQAELQGALNRVAALEARLRSLDAALVTHGLIGP
ncbi:MULTISPECIES: hypothetical protein [unclassified Mesorhizobium]|uniref:hypothetical protein n=1 Tax=Mesorhizobium sp. LNJC398B00 TaxID=1287276 RepID=UPI0003CDF536|nr:hypothetical protein [Mesorhizobium sp. LNJC398B00]ESY10490.1 hypothetical protein X752_13960 [Mesorhizobium sp. LNJC398B00]